MKQKKRGKAPQVNPPLPAQFWTEMEKTPYIYDLFNTLRWIDARSSTRYPLGRAPTPQDEPVRMKQEPSMAFAPATVASATTQTADGKPHISIYSFGLFGPNGPLPLHLTEYVRERAHHFNDRSLAEFANIFHHRLILLFYRAWADSQGTVALDRPEKSRFTEYVASLVHLGQPSLRGGHDGIADHAKYFMSGHLVRQTRNPDGLRQILQHYFGIPVRIQEYVSQWIEIDPTQRTWLLSSGPTAQLGKGALLGSHVLDAQHKFRIELGPMSLENYSKFLPGQVYARKLISWVRHYIGYELAWDVRLILQRQQVPLARVGSPLPLGFTTWLGKRPQKTDAEDLVLDLELRGAIQ